MSRTKRLAAFILLPLAAVTTLTVVGPTAGTALASPDRVHF
ncbi:hypothetical protein [Nocardia concava]|nr:hypothetical protein [Nocardia concava]